MKAIFLADVHLQGGTGGREEKLLRFFDSLGAGASRPDRLILAGDVFDFWFSRKGIIYPGFAPVVERLISLKQAGVEIMLCEGNHDFHLADYFTARLSMAVSPDGTEIAGDGLRIFISHGDTVDQGNRRYLALRRFLRSRFAFALQRILPLPLLWNIARFSSALSKETSGESSERLAGVMYRFALGKFAAGYDAVVLGHCHRPLLKEVDCGGRRCVFATLGDWIGHDSYLRLEEGRFVLERFEPGG